MSNFSTESLLQTSIAEISQTDENKHVKQMGTADVDVLFVATSESDTNSATPQTQEVKISDVSAVKSSTNKSPVEIKVYNDRQQLVLDRHTNTSSCYCTKSMLRPCSYHSAREPRTPLYNSATDFVNRGLIDYYGYSTTRSYTHHYPESMYQTNSRKGYHSYRVHPYPQSYYQYSAMPAGNNVRLQPSVKHSTSKIKPLQSPVPPAAASQKCSPLTPAPISPSFLSPSNSLPWSPINEWDRPAKVTPPPTVTEWNRLAKATPPSSPINDWDRLTKATPSPVVNSSPLSSLSSLISPISVSNGFTEHHPFCGCKPISNGLYHTPPSQSPNMSTNYTTGGSPRSPHQSKRQEDYARKLYSLRHALKSDVFMGYGKNTERYELYADDRPVSPLKLLEINPSLDWSNEIATANLELEENEIDDESLFLSINMMSQALTR